MCLVKKPKISTAAAQEKPVQVFTNRYFVDRGEDAVAARAGRNALKIERGSTRAKPTPSITSGVQSIVASGPQAPTMGSTLQERRLNGALLIR